MTTYTDVVTIDYYTTETRTIAGYWTYRPESCATYYSYEKRPVARGVLGLLWLLLDGIMWGAFFLTKGKAMSYLRAIRLEEDMNRIYEEPGLYDESVYSFDTSAFNF